MQSKSHQGIVSKAVTIEFENGYSLTLDAGIEIGLFIAIAEVQPKNEVNPMLNTIEVFAPVKDKAG